MSNRPSGRGGLDLGLFRKSNRPSGRGGWTLDFKKERNQVEGGGCYKVTLVSAVRLKNDTLEHTHGNPAHKAQSLSPYNAEGLRYLAVWLAGLFTEGVGFCAAGESVSPVIDFGARLLGRHRLLLLLHHHEGTAADEQEAHDRANDDADERPRGEPVVRRRRAVVALVRRLRQSSVCIKPR